MVDRWIHTEPTNRKSKLELAFEVNLVVTSEEGYLSDMN